MPDPFIEEQLELFSACGLQPDARVYPLTSEVDVKITENMDGQVCLQVRENGDTTYVFFSWQPADALDFKRAISIGYAIGRQS